jgi:hypothetical protein
MRADAGENMTSAIDNMRINEVSLNTVRGCFGAAAADMEDEVVPSGHSVTVRPSAGFNSDGGFDRFL